MPMSGRGLGMGLATTTTTTKAAWLDEETLR